MIDIGKLHVLSPGKSGKSPVKTTRKLAALLQLLEVCSQLS